jgi:hypothetical protein
VRLFVFAVVLWLAKPRIVSRSKLVICGKRVPHPKLRRARLRLQCRRCFRIRRPIAFGFPGRPTSFSSGIRSLIRPIQAATAYRPRHNVRRRASLDCSPACALPAHPRCYATFRKPGATAWEKRLGAGFTNLDVVRNPQHLTGAVRGAPDVAPDHSPRPVEGEQLLGVFTFSTPPERRIEIRFGKFSMAQTSSTPTPTGSRWHRRFDRAVLRVCFQRHFARSPAISGARRI